MIGNNSLIKTYDKKLNLKIKPHQKNLEEWRRVGIFLYGFKFPCDFKAR